VYYSISNTINKRKQINMLNTDKYSDRRPYRKGKRELEAVTLPLKEGRSDARRGDTAT